MAIKPAFMAVTLLVNQLASRYSFFSHE